MSTDTDPAFKRIDDALATYYVRLGISDYHDNDGKGVFLKYIIEEELNDSEFPIDNELGDDCDPYDCAYSWMSSFPVPSYANIPQSQRQKEAFIFYILQYCYKHNKAPSDQYIQQTVITKCNGKVLTQKKTNTNDNPSEAPTAYADVAMTDTDHTEQLVQTDKGYISDIEGVIPCGVSGKENEQLQVIRLKDTPFKPKYPSRAHLNVFTPKEWTTVLRDEIEEKFDDTSLLYYYTDLSTALQINDGQIKEFTIMVGDKEQRLCIINYDLHVKGQPQEFLYGIIVPNDTAKVRNDKWLWKLNGFMTAHQIFNQYKISSSELPLSSRRMLRFQKELRQRLVINSSLMDETDWFSVQQIKSLKRNVNLPKVTIALSKEMWIAECKKSFQNVDLPLIPVVVNKNNTHWIEWIKIIHISSQNMYIGISCKYHDKTNEFSVESICLDRGDIYNKHRLVGLNMDKFKAQLKNFKTSITEIAFTDKDTNNGDKKSAVLKEQIRWQQESIVRLKDALTKASINIAIEPIGEQIQQFIDEDNEDDSALDVEDAWLNQIVDDVIKRYVVMEFKTSPIGAKKNIYIDKQITKLWMKHVSPCFNDDIIFYYWLDYTSAMQMCQGYSKQYIDKDTNKFMLAIINYELVDINNNILYGIIFGDDDKSVNDKYPFRLTTFMTTEQIEMEFGIMKYDLPKKSRKNKDFIQKLLLKRRIITKDLDRISWSNLKLYKSQATNNDPIHKSVTITQRIMKEYCVIALERLNSSNVNDLIPILVIDKHRSYYAVEWVLIVHIIHRNCDVGVSFSYDRDANVFGATAIYLDKGEIEAKHKLIGLKYDYCKHLRSFSLRKLRFKSGVHSNIDDEDDTTIHNGNRANTALKQMQKKLTECQNKYQQLQIYYANQYNNAYNNEYNY